MTPTVFHLTPRRRLAASLTILAALAIALTVARPAWSQDGNGVYKTGDGVKPPAVTFKVDPQYTQEDKDAKVEGTVLLQVVVTAEGKADNIKVVKGVSTGLDEKAIEAVQKWTFQPGTKDGQPVAVYATIEVNFRLK